MTDDQLVVLPAEQCNVLSLGRCPKLIIKRRERQSPALR